MGFCTLAAGGKEERVGRAQEVEVGGRKRGVSKAKFFTIMSSCH